MDTITWVGLDAHKDTIQVAMLKPGQTQALEWGLPNEAEQVRKLVMKLERHAPGEVRCCYEAGPCGFVLQRQMHAAAKTLVCEVIAPALIPRKPGDRVKTDRRDARKLAELLRAGLLTEVSAPSEAQEAARDLSRCREDAMSDLTRSRHRLVKFLLRHGHVYRDGTAWTKGHGEWLQSLRFDDPVERAIFNDYRLAVDQLLERIKLLEAQINNVAQEPVYREQVAHLRCFRGIDTVTAFGLIVELHGVTRFSSPRQLMAYLGLVPSERSSGGSTKRGGITKAGNMHARKLLIEAAWHYRHAPAVGKKLRLRRQGQPAPALALADKAQQRLYRRYRRLTERGLPAARTVVAVARELAGFVWAALSRAEASLGASPQTPEAPREWATTIEAPKRRKRSESAPRREPNRAHSLGAQRAVPHKSLPM